MPIVQDGAPGCFLRGVAVGSDDVKCAREMPCRSNVDSKRSLLQTQYSDGGWMEPRRKTIAEER